MPFALARLRERSASVTHALECRPALSTMAQPRERRSASFTHAGDLVDLLPKKQDPLAHDLRRAAILASAQEALSVANDDVDASGKRTFPKKCDFPLCKNSSRSRGFCYSHGGGRRCRVDGCPNGAVSRDLCKRHGGGRRCRIAGCKSSSESGGLCYSHGGGKRCNLPNCTARAKKGGLCGQHQVGGSSADNTPSTSTQCTPQLGPIEEPSAHVVETLLALGHSDPSTGSEDDSDSSDPTHQPADQENENSMNWSASASDVGTPTSRGRSLSIAALLN